MIHTSIQAAVAIIDANMLWDDQASILKHAAMCSQTERNHFEYLR